MLNQEIEIYVTDSVLAGKPYGDWIDMTQDIEDIQNDINDTLKESGYPNSDYMIASWSGYGKMTSHDFETLQDLKDLSDFIQEESESYISKSPNYGDSGPVLAALSLQSFSIEYARETLDNYVGYFRDDEELNSHLLVEFLKSRGCTVENLELYINPSQYAINSLNNDYYIDCEQKELTRDKKYVELFLHVFDMY